MLEWYQERWSWFGGRRKRLKFFDAQENDRRGEPLLSVISPPQTNPPSDNHYHYHHYHSWITRVWLLFYSSLLAIEDQLRSINCSIPAYYYAFSSRRQAPGRTRSHRHSSRDLNTPRAWFPSPFKNCMLICIILDIEYPSWSDRVIPLRLSHREWCQSGSVGSRISLLLLCLSIITLLIMVYRSWSRIFEGRLLFNKVYRTGKPCRNECGHAVQAVGCCARCLDDRMFYIKVGPTALFVCLLFYDTWDTHGSSL